LGCMIRLTSCHLWLGAGAEWILKILFHAKMALARCSDQWSMCFHDGSVLQTLYSSEFLFLHLCKKMQIIWFTLYRALMQFKNKAHLSAIWNKYFYVEVCVSSLPATLFLFVIRTSNLEIAFCYKDMPISRSLAPSTKQLPSANL